MAMRSALAATCRSCADGSARGQRRGPDALGGEGFFRRAAGRDVDADLAADGVALAVGTGLVGVAGTARHQPGAGRHVRQFVGAE